jgi:hypothetical protein
LIFVEQRVPASREEITKFSVKYRNKITSHPNEIALHYLRKKSVED